MHAPSADLLSQNRVFVWIALATGIVLLVPLSAMQFTDEVTWDVGDFLVMGALLFATGFVFVLLARRMREHWVVIGVALLAALVWLWAELAVGVFTSWGS
jgi:hypothetical protein